MSIVRAETKEERVKEITSEKFLEAAEKGGPENIEIVRKYIEANRNNLEKINVRAQDYCQSTALVLAAHCRNTEIVELLLAVPGIELNAEWNHATALAWAAHNNDSRVFQALLNMPGININKASDEWRAPIIWAAENNLPLFCKSLCNRSGLSIPALNRAFYYAAFHGHLEVVNILLAAGKVDINALQVEWRQMRTTPLIVAAMNGHAAVVQALLDHGACATFMSDRGTAEERARNAGKNQAADVLAAHLDQLSSVNQARLDAIGYDIEKVPSKYCCPKSGKIMSDPIVASSGVAYERRALRKMFVAQGDPDAIPCRVKGAPIQRGDVNNGACVFLKDEIETFIKRLEKNYAEKSEAKDESKDQLIQRLTKQLQERDKTIAELTAQLKEKKPAEEKSSSSRRFFDKPFAPKEPMTSSVLPKLSV